MGTINPQDSRLSISRQCGLLGIARASFYYQPKEVSAENLLLVRLLDGQYLGTPFFGSRRFAEYLRSLGYLVNRKRVRRLMQAMGSRRRQWVNQSTHSSVAYSRLSRVWGSCLRMSSVL